MPERAEIEAVAREMGGPAAWPMFLRAAEMAIEAVDRVRDARGDDEARCSQCERAWPSSQFECPCGAAISYRNPARSPHGEDHEARSFTICTRCWVVVGIDGENNLDRATTVCSHLGPFIQARGNG